ncbi:MAG: glutamyl-tRNA reductase [Gammaproteobacteria bacterium RIFCSPHIGHO2_12_FULL_41_20]|nr:MAG: glutamyl-tRNA reductase [Gammaproteobacteria bacterium RIFCSPHIGHO2_12_FULL_41_20]
MTILVVGINHKTAPIELREQVFFSQDNLSLYLQDLLSCGVVQEAVLLSTCNRSELYCETEEVEKVQAWFCSQHALPAEIVTRSMYCYQGAEAIAHMMMVACGLDSMILGEPQILGQMKAAFSDSCTAGAVGSLFHRLFQEVFTVAKEIRTTTSIGACPVSLASSALHFVKQRIADLQWAKTVVVGAGETAELLLRYLKTYGIEPYAIVNRSHSKAMHLTQQYGGKVHILEELPTVLTYADLVFTTTGSTMPIISHAMLQAVWPLRNHKPLLILDMAVPRDVELRVATLSGVELYCIDDLKGVIEQHRQGREHAADKAKEKIEQKSRDFMLWLNSLDKVNHTIRACREQVEALCHIELMKAKQQLSHGYEPELVLEGFARALAKRLLHTPSVQLRQAGAEGQFELLHLARRLFALPDPEVKTS